MIPEHRVASELECRVERAKEILEFILKHRIVILRDDFKRIYNVLAHGAKYARMYRTKKA